MKNKRQNDDCEAEPVIPVLPTRFVNEKLQIQCPQCGRWQPFIIGPEDYLVDSEGLVWPEFVCRKVRAFNHKLCSFSAIIKIKV